MKNVKAGGFYWERELYQSEAFLSLSKSAMKIIIALLDNRRQEPKSQAKDKKGRKRRPKFTNLDCLEIPYGVLEKVYRIPKGTIPRALDEIMEKGFVTLSYHGGNFVHDKSKYCWSDNYLLWKPGCEPFAKRPARPKYGFQGQGKGAISLNTTRKNEPIHIRKNEPQEGKKGFGK
jgi:hypothetical protein